MAIRSALTRMVFSLPAPMLEAMAGGRVTVEGCTLDPRVALMARQAKMVPPVTSFPAPVARKMMQTALGLIDAPRRPGVSVRDLKVPGPAGELDARLYAPPNATGGEPLLVYFHQGGCVLGGLWTCDAWCSMLAEDARVVVLNVDYRHAPEHKFPAAVDDAVAAWRWAVENAKSLGADERRVGVGGDSAGGYLSAVVCHAMKRSGGPQPFLQLLIYAAVDWTATDGTMATMADAYPLNAGMMTWFAGHYLNSLDETSDWRVSPALQEDRAGLAPALVYTAGFDPLASQGRAYADALEAAGVKALYRNYPTLPHAFTAMSGAVPAARLALAEIAADVKAAFG